jgi:vacuolar-type H+-ATPase subunit H
MAVQGSVIQSLVSYERELIDGVKQAENEAEQIIADARAKGQRLREESTAAARKQAQEKREAAARNRDKERARLIEAAHSEAAELHERTAPKIDAMVAEMTALILPGGEGGHA